MNENDVTNPTQPQEPPSPITPPPQSAFGITQKKNIFIIIGLIFLMVIIGMGVYFLGTKNNNGTQQSSINTSDKQISITPSANPVFKTGDTSKVFYAVQEDSASPRHTLYVTSTNGSGTQKLLEYSGGYEVGSYLPKVSENGIVLYLDGRNKLVTTNLQGNQKVIAEAPQGFEIRNFAISDDGSTILYQQFDKPEPGQSCTSFTLWKADTTSGNREQLFSSDKTYLDPVKISDSNGKAFVLSGNLSGGEASCYGQVTNLGTITFATKGLSVIKTQHPSGILISPNEKYAVTAFSTNPASPLISTPSKQYPIKMVLVDLINGVEVSLVESSDKYIFPVGWYSDSSSVLYREQAPDTATDYQNIADIYKKIDVGTKQITSLFSLTRRGAGMEFNQIVNDSYMVYTKRNDQDWINGTSLSAINLDGTNETELDKKIRFLYLLGVSRN